MFDLGGGELLLIVLAVLIFFGPKKLPELAQSLGRGMREFKRAQREFTEQINQAVSDEHYKKTKSPELKGPDGAVARGASRRSESLRPSDDATAVVPDASAAGTVSMVSTVDQPREAGEVPHDAGEQPRDGGATSRDGGELSRHAGEQRRDERDSQLGGAGSQEHAGESPRDAD